MSDAERAGSGFFGQIRGLSTTYWIADLIEILERLSYYGLRTVVPVYMVLAVEEGGPQFTHVQKALVFTWWAGFQSLLPILSGGYADKWGLKRTVAISVVLKAVGFVIMGAALKLGAMSSGGASVGVAGHPAVLAWFLAGTIVLATGTAVFKPGIQGIVASQINDQNGSLAWGIFYQVVNVGGFFGPLLAGYMKVIGWEFVFLACAAIALLNLPLLLTFKEPERPVAEPVSFLTTLTRSVEGILEPRLFAFLAIFSGFWAMFHQLFDLLPNFIVDWVDTQPLYEGVVVPAFALVGSAPGAAWGGEVPQEYLLNINAFMIMFTGFLFGYLSGQIRAMSSMIVGILMCAGGIAFLGTTAVWGVIAAVAVFSIGEMFASPTKLRYMTEIAPPGQKALFLGYVNATDGIGWVIGSSLAGALYEAGGDKVVLARRHLETLGVDAATVDGLAKTEVLPTLAQKLGTTPAAAQQLLWDTYAPAAVWGHFATIGIVSMIGLVLYDQITRRALPGEAWGLAALTGLVTGAAYGVGYGVAFGALVALRVAVGARIAGRVALVLVALGLVRAVLHAFGLSVPLVDGLMEAAGSSGH